MSDLAKVLDAVSSALTVIKTVADTPGINIIPYAATISSAIAALQTAYTVGKNITPYIVAIKDTFTGGVPTEAELAALDAKIADLEAKADAPLPPKEDGEPD
jgi:hypothetical protein